MNDPEQTQARLQREHPSWRIWRGTGKNGPGVWVATSRRPDSNDAPTLVADTPEDLERQLKNPPRGYGRPSKREIVRLLEAMR